MDNVISLDDIVDVTNKTLLDIFKCGYRIAESKSNKSNLVASNKEIECDGVPIIENLLKECVK